MRGLTASQLIALLIENAKPDASIILEGCDCAEKCVGISIGHEVYKNCIILRRDGGGVFDTDDLEIVLDNTKG